MEKEVASSQGPHKTRRLQGMAQHGSPSLILPSSFDSGPAPWMDIRYGSRGRETEAKGVYFMVPNNTNNKIKIK